MAVVETPGRRKWVRSVSHLEVGFRVHGVIQTLSDPGPEPEMSVRLVDVGSWVVVTSVSTRYRLGCGSSYGSRF